MKGVLSGILAAVAGMVLAHNTMAAAKPPQPTPGKGIVIVRLDGSADLPGIYGQSMDLQVAPFDAAARKPYFEMDAGKDMYFEEWRASSGRSYLIWRTAAGPSVFGLYRTQRTWSMCLNNGSYSFDVARDGFTYLGGFDHWGTRAQILRAIEEKRLAETVTPPAHAPVLMGGHMEGFTPTSGSAEELTQVQADISEIYTRPVTVAAGDTTAITFETTMYKQWTGKVAEECFAPVQKTKRP